MTSWLSRFWTWLKGVDADALAAEITKVQALTAKTCRFVPTAASVAALLTAGNPAVATVASIATAICAAITGNKKLGLITGPAPIIVNGVKVEGEFIPDD